MSTATKNRPVSEKVGKPVRASKTRDVLVIGGSPRVSLLPPEVMARAKGRVLRRRLGLGFIGAVVLVALGIGLTTVSMLGAQGNLLTQQNRATDLLAQQSKYGQVTQIQADSLAIQSAQKTATASEIEWAPYIVKLQSTLTPGMSITSVKAAMLSTADAGAVATPLQGSHVATLAVTVSTPQASISNWLTSLQALPGFVDATPGSVSLLDGQYVVAVNINISDAALAHRFSAKQK